MKLSNVQSGPHRLTVQRGLRRLGSGLLGVALISSALVGAGGISAPAPAQAVMTDGPTGFTERPGVPKAPTQVFVENFENIEKDGPIVPLVDYVSTNEFPAGTPLRYTAEGMWADPYASCNGFVTSASNKMGATCAGNAASQGGLGALADVLGQVNGAADPTKNAVVAAYTGGPAGAADLIQLETAGELIPLTTPNRFVTFSVNAAAVSCHAAQPTMRFSVVANGVETPISGLEGINPCTDSRAEVYAPTSDPSNTVFYAGTFASGGSFITTGSPIGLVMRNGSGATAGNDGAIDDIRLLDVTPHLNKEFSGPSIATHGSSTLTFTVTNTSELASKDGWAFTDTLRSGLEFADTPNLGGTCDATSTISGSALQVTGGTLAEGEVSCTITVDVTSATPTGAAISPKTYTNNITDISNIIGLDATNETTVEFFSEPKLKISKSNSAAENPAIGDVVTYTVTAQNTGNGDFGSNQQDAALKNATVTDDLSDVLDDANLDLASLKATVGGVEVAAPVWDATAKTITWSGPLQADADAATKNAPYSGELVVITYDVVLKGGGNGTALNTACVAAAVAEGDACATSVAELPSLEIEKAASTTSVSATGETIDYTVTVTNNSAVSWTPANPANISDDLSEVIDDAELDLDSLRATIGSASVIAPVFSAATKTLSWAGALGAGESVELAYSVTYTGAGDQELVNTACVPADSVRPGVGACDTVTVTGSKLAVEKTSTGSADPLVAGSTVEYTLWFENTGPAAASVDYVDSLTQVLDDADVTVEPAAGVGNLTPVRVGDETTVTGSVPGGERYSVVYTVTLKADDARADDQLVNYLLPKGTTPPAEAEVCETATAQSDGVTAQTCNPVFTPVPVLVIEKGAAHSNTPLVSGATIDYTLTFHSTGNVAVEVDYADYLAHVLDDADVTVEPVAGTGDLVAVRTGDTISVTGTVPQGESYTVTYTVKVKAEAERGDSVVVNFLMPSELIPPTEVPTACAAPAAGDGVVAETCAVVTDPPAPVVPADKEPADKDSADKKPVDEKPTDPLASTGAAPMALVAGGATLLLAAGLLLVALRRRKLVR